MKKVAEDVVVVLADQRGGPPHRDLVPGEPPRGTDDQPLSDDRVIDPVQDLAWWLASDRCFSEGLELERLPGIPSHEQTVARWKEATGLDTSNLAYYSILALARFSMNMARIGQYMKKIEIIDEENEFDYENLASITLRRALTEI